jgi:hypothetical protein
VHDDSPELEPHAEDNKADDTARLSSNSRPPSNSEIADAGGNGSHPPTHDADAAEQPEEGDGDGNNDDDDDEAFDALDKAAAAIRYDYQRRTLPYPEAVDGAAVLDKIVAFINRFNAALPKGAAEVLTLLTVLTYAVYSCGLRFAPRLMVRKPVSNAGGTNLLTMLLYLVRRPKYNSGITEANFLRQAKNRRTVIIDECDGVLKANAKLVKMINAGHGHQGSESRIIKNETVEFPVFSPVFLCGIGDFAPVTIRNRSLVIPMRRMMAGEDADEFNPDDHAPMMRTIREKIMRWVEDHIKAIRECRPVLDRALAMNRQRDNILTLLKIADVVGGEWSQRGRDALTALTARDKPLDENELLIGDIAEILLDPEVRVGDTPQPIGKFVFSDDLFTLLKERFPHRLLYESNFTKAKLASMLSTFEIEPCQHRRGAKNWRGYPRSDFDDAIARYAPDAIAAFEEPATPLQPDILDREAARSNVAPSDGDMGSTAAPAAEPAPQPPAPKIVYPKARVEKTAPGDKKRDHKLRRGVDAVMRAGDAEPDAVAFICARFWIVNRDGKACFVHLIDDGELEWLPIAPPGLLAENGTLRISPEKSLPLADGDFVLVRALVNKYRKTVR